MSYNNSGFSRRGPDNVTEELAVVLSTKASYEFKALFDIVHCNLKLRNAANGGEEMLRLRSYEKLQNMVGDGVVKKTGKKYRGNSTAVRALTLRLKTMRAEMAKRFAPAPVKGLNRGQLSSVRTERHARIPVL